MKLNKKRTILVGMAFMSICAFWQVYDGIVPLILKKVFNMNDTLSGFIMALDNILALFMLPFFGNLSDRTRTKIGRRMPYILIGTAVAVIGIIILPLASAAKNLTIFIIGLAIVLLAMSTYRSPAVALMPDITPKPLRSQANAIINLTGALGGLIALAAIAFLVPKGEDPSYLPIFLFTAAFMIICIIVLKLTVNENKLRLEDDEEPETKDPSASDGKDMPREVRKSLYLILASIFFWFMGYNAITTSFSKYANVYWGLDGGSYAYTLMIAQVAAIISYIPVGAVASRIGRKKTILCGIVMLTFAFGCCVFFKSFTGVIFLLFILAGIGWASINVNSYPMVVEMSKGSNIGKYTGLYYTFSMLAQIITPILSGAVLQYMGYVFLFPYGALFTAISFVTMYFVKHGDSRPNMPSEKLEVFNDI